MFWHPCITAVALYTISLTYHRQYRNVAVWVVVPDHQIIRPWFCQCTVVRCLLGSSFLYMRTGFCFFDLMAIASICACMLLYECGHMYSI